MSAPVDPLDLPDWAVEPMLAVGFTLDELRAVPFPLTDEERAAYCALDDLDQREFTHRRRELLSQVNALVRAAE